MTNSVQGEQNITLFLAGDVMTGRGIDQVLPHPSEPHLYEPYVRDARIYVQLAEQVNGPITRPVGFEYIWGVASGELQRLNPDVRIINLETSITTSEANWKGKSIHYRMHPKNIPCITVADIDVCSLANNHTLDWGYPGLVESLETLEKAQVTVVGAGRNFRDAEAPAIIEVEGKGRVIVYACGLTSSGIAREAGARKNRPGVNLLPDLSERTVASIRKRIEAVKRPGDVVVISIHWGSNWGYDIPRKQRLFAHDLIDEAGVDIIYGHSSHHVKGIEVYSGRLILYGCGDFLNDYEGIGGYEGYRADLTLMYLPSLEPATGKLITLRMIPLQIRKFRLNRVTRADAVWLMNMLNREGRKMGSRVQLESDNSLVLGWEYGAGRD